MLSNFNMLSGRNLKSELRGENQYFLYRKKKIMFLYQNNNIENAQLSDNRSTLISRISYFYFLD